MENKATSDAKLNPQAKHKLIVCADDYAFSPSVDHAIVQLIKAKQLSATSCMTLSPRWRQSAQPLKPLRGQADIGLHLDFTEFSQLIRINHLQLVLRCMFRLISKSVVKQNIIQQLDAYEAVMGSAPDFIDGHLHVHQLPVIRDSLLEVLSMRYGDGVNYSASRPWLRVSRPPIGAGFKGIVIRMLGANALARQATKMGFRVSPLLLGVYDFSGGHSSYFMQWKTWLLELQHYYRNHPVTISQVPVVLMCHPAASEDNLHDPIAKARVQEWQLLQSAAFAEWGDVSGLELVKGSTDKVV